MTGSIRCTRCSTSIDVQGVCPSCGSPRVYIAVYWKGRQYKFRRDGKGIIFSYMTAADQLIAMSRDMREKKFNPGDWLPGNVVERRIDRVIYDWLAEKIEEMDAGELSPGTLKDYKGYVKNHYVPKLGAFDVREIRYEQLKNFKDKQLRGLKLKTRRNIMHALKTFFNWAMARGTIKELPTFPVIEGNDSDVRTAIPYEEQMAGLSKVPEEHRDVLEFGFETGLRPGETTALKIWDIQLSTRTALIQRTFTGSQIRETTKGKNKRYIPLSDRAFEIVQKHLRARDGGEFLFVNRDTQSHYTVKKLNQLWRKYSGVDCTHYEASRHSFCTQIVESGASLPEAQALMRHASADSTNKYFHSRTERLRKFTNRRSNIVYLKQEGEK